MRPEGCRGGGCEDSVALLGEPDRRIGRDRAAISEGAAGQQELRAPRDDRRLGTEVRDDQNPFALGRGVDKRKDVLGKSLQPAQRTQAKTPFATDGEQRAIQLEG
jgi:hypothetical protein